MAELHKTGRRTQRDVTNPRSSPTTALVDFRHEPARRLFKLPAATGGQYALRRTTTGFDQGHGELESRWRGRLREVTAARPKSVRSCDKRGILRIPAETRPVQALFALICNSAYLGCFRSGFSRKLFTAPTMCPLSSINGAIFTITTMRLPSGL